jgi:hypothetical protein
MSNLFQQSNLNPPDIADISRQRLLANVMDPAIDPNRYSLTGKPRKIWVFLS